jgi:hypothetical protein
MRRRPRRKPPRRAFVALSGPVFRQSVSGGRDALRGTRHSGAACAAGRHWCARHSAPVGRSPQCLTLVCGALATATGAAREAGRRRRAGEAARGATRLRGGGGGF